MPRLLLDHTQPTPPAAQALAAMESEAQALLARTQEQAEALMAAASMQRKAVISREERVIAEEQRLRAEAARLDAERRQWEADVQGAIRGRLRRRAARVGPKRSCRHHNAHLSVTPVSLPPHALRRRSVLRHELEQGVREREAQLLARRQREEEAERRAREAGTCVGGGGRGRRA